jgi:predicted metal-dependent HD superfamily phosphohydrolase
MVARLAAYYHDVVYVPGWKLNETLSAEYAQVHLNHLAGGQAVVEPVKRAISATRDHIVSSYDGLAAQWLVDADLYELGTDRYEANGANVRAEFGDVPDHLWIAGRKRFLYTYLGRETIFYTAGQERVENKARDNMEAELGRLIRGEV